jgi:protein disulfide-isomerase A6
VANIDADDEMNKDIAKKYDVSSFPTIKFFSTDNKDGIAYEGGRTEADFVQYLNEKCGTHRQVGGGLNEKVRIS